jgi:hypothetical protein
MPTISEFFGILIRMYWDDHPPPHFHAIYAEHEAQYNIATLDVIQGALPRRAPLCANNDCNTYLRQFRVQR